jgi:hypothetical protein
VRLISQPFAGFASQSAKPALHAATEHFELAQFSVAWLVLQARPQPPQSFTLVVMSISHPLAGFRSQSEVPFMQADTVQTWLSHSSVAVVAVHA